MASAITSRPSPGAPGKKRGVADLAKSAVNTRSATAAAALAPVLGSRDDSSAEASVIDPFARLRVQPGLGNVSRLKGETIACDTMMEKYTPSHWQGKKAWQKRRVVLTNHSIFFFKENSEDIVDLIPLIAISSVERSSAAPHSLLQHTASMSARPAEEGRPMPSLQQTKTQFAASFNLPLFLNLKSSDLSVALSQNVSLKHVKETCPDFDTAADVVNAGVVIKTDANGIFQGKVYYFKCQDEEEADHFVEEASRLHSADISKHRKRRLGHRLRSEIRTVYEHIYFQAFIAVMIMGNFFCSMIELQIPVTEEQKKLFAIMDVAFTVIFLIELVMNMVCNWFWKFWTSAFNVFDFVIVCITTISLLPFLDMRVISTLRLLRAFRVVRIFRRLQSARRIITAIVTSIEPVCNVLVVVLGIACVFAMFGATAYDQAPMFQTFSEALYTMFVVMCLDGWNDLVLEIEDLYPGTTSVPPKMFFLLYIFIVVRKRPQCLQICGQHMSMYAVRPYG